ELWESIPEFSEPAASFEHFIAAIFRLYPEADPDRRYSLTDFDALVTELSRIQSLSRPRFLEFYRRFFVISTFLLAKNRLSTLEQSRSFARAIPSNIWHRTRERLRIKFPHVHPLDPYPLHDLRDAVDFVLLDPDSHLPLPVTSPSPTLVPIESSAPPEPSIAALVDAAHQLIELVSSQQQPSPAALHLDSQPPPSPRPASCSYCSDPAHFIARCPLGQVWEWYRQPFPPP
ncbi:hypothetical protein B0H13DRAFT_1588364, partial [Mycena leptocephala]